MIITTPHPGEAHVHLDHGEKFFYPWSYLAAGAYNRSLVPPFPLSSPIARLIYGRYWLSKATAPADGLDLVLNEPNPLNHFHVVTLGAQESAFVHCAHLIGFSLQGGRISTYLGGIRHPALWLISHPLPVIAAGPCTILLTGCRLQESHGPGEHLAGQIIAFDASATWSVRAPRSDAMLISDLWNVVSGQCQLVFSAPTRHVRSQVMPSRMSIHWRAIRILLHLALLALVAAILRS